MANEPPVTRRDALAGLTALGAVALVGCSSSSDRASSTSTSTSSTTATSRAVEASCVLTPEQMEGPFYLDLRRVRQDITEGRPGRPLDLEVRVVEAGACGPLPNVAVDIWHCDALGIYSGYGDVAITADHVEPVNDDTFFRGTQITDAQGRCTFTTIVPGWYPGRSPHIHIKAHPSPSTQVTTQMYFPEAALAEVYRAAPYSEHPGQHVPYDQDSLNQAVRPEPLQLVRTGSGFATAFVLGVDST